MPVVYDVEVVDVSQSGLLLWCQHALDVGQRAQIRAVIQGEPFTALMEVVRIDDPGAARRRSRRRCVAAAFVALDEGNRGTLQRLLVSPR